MIIDLVEYKGKKYASAKLIYDYLGIKRRFSIWIKESINIAKLKDGDFVTYKLQSTGGRPMIEYLLKKNPAIKIVLQSRMEKSVDLMDLLIKIFEEKQTGISLTVDQVTALTDMVKAMTLVSIQENAQNKHFYYYNKPDKWWEYRAELLGYSKKSLIEALKKVNKKYKNTRKALIKLDPSELIRSGVIDLLISLGRDREYAINIGEWAKGIAKSNDYHLQIWDDTIDNPLKLNEHIVNERKKLFNKSKSIK